VTELLRRRRPSRRRDAEGQMPLVEHLRELRTRVLKALVAIVLGAVIGWIYYKPLFEFLVQPFESSCATTDARSTSRSSA
jgi:sec-independent protein translocase protein TatC